MLTTKSHFFKSTIGVDIDPMTQWAVVEVYRLEHIERTQLHKVCKYVIKLKTLLMRRLVSSKIKNSIKSYLPV